jgi:hypothetical protein
MAVKMRHLFVATATVAALIVLWQLPPTRPESHPALSTWQRDLSAYARRVMTVNRHRTQTTALLRAVELRDSLTSLATADDQLTVITAYPPGDSLAAVEAEMIEDAPEFTDRMNRWRADSLTRYPYGATRRVPTFVYVNLSRQNRWLDSYVWLPSPDAAGSNACMRVIGGRWSAQRALNSHRPSDVLSTCSFFAKYGLPGNSVFRWLVSSGGTFAVIAQPVAATPWYNGEWAFAQRRGGLQATRCAAGDRDLCRDLILNTGVRQTYLLGEQLDYLPNGFIPLFEGTRGQPFGLPTGGLVATWEAELGPEAFATFWHSNADLPQAFRAAFGVDLGEWVETWARENIGPPVTGPGLANTDIALTVLVTIVLGGLGARASRRRSL